MAQSSYVYFHSHQSPLISLSELFCPHLHSVTVAVNAESRFQNKTLMGNTLNTLKHQLPGQT